MTLNDKVLSRDRPELDKEPIESWDHVRNRFDDLLKRPIDRFRWHRDILPRYIDGHLSLHLHIALHGRVLCCCISRNSEGGRLAHEIGIEGRVSQRDGHVIELSDGEQRHPMLVSVYEFMEPPERFVPSVVRLRRLDLGNRVCGELAIRKTIQTILETFIRRGFKERKRNDAPVVKVGDVERRVEIPLGEFPDDVVQGLVDDSSLLTSSFSRLPFLLASVDFRLGNRHDFLAKFNEPLSRTLVRRER